MMKTLLVAFFSLFTLAALAQLNMDIPVNTGALDAANGVTGRLNQFDQSSDGKPTRDQQRQEEEAGFNENEYAEPSDAEFNKNWDQESQSVTLPD